MNPLSNFKLAEITLSHTGSLEMVPVAASRGAPSTYYICLKMVYSAFTMGVLSSIIVSVLAAERLRDRRRLCDKHFVERDTKSIISGWRNSFGWNENIMTSALLPINDDHHKKNVGSVFVKFKNMIAPPKAKAE